MNEHFFVGKRVSSFDEKKARLPISKVVLWLDSQNAIVSGDDTGTVIEQNCPYATQEMADNLLSVLSGYEYQPFSASNAVIDPLAELGDGITVNGQHGVLGYQKIYFAPGQLCDISAPGAGEVSNEYAVGGYNKVETNREIKKVGSSITKTAEEIRLEVAAFVESVNGDVSELQSSITQTAKDIRAEVSRLETSINGTLESYATIELTAEMFNTAVSNSKSYTDSKTGEVISKFDAYSTIDQTATAISMAVNQSQETINAGIKETLKNYATLDLTTERFNTAVSNSKNYTDSKTGEVVAMLDSYSTIDQTSSAISMAVNQSEQTIQNGITTTLLNYATLDLTTERFNTAVSSSKTYTDSQTGEVRTLLDSYSTIDQTASAINLAVNGLVDGKYVSSSIDAALGALSLSASSSDGITTLTLKGGETELSTKSLKLSVDAAYIKGTLTIGQLPEDVATMEDIPDTSDFALSEDVPQRLSDLINAAADVTTIVKGTVTAKYINAMAITAAYVSADGVTAGTLDADFLALDGLLELKNGTARGYVGANNAKNGAVLASENMSVYVIANDTTAKMSSFEDHMIWVHTSGCFATDTLQISSDRTMKDNINYDLSEEESLFSTLLPCSFSYISDKSAKKHWGFIAQDFIGSAEGLGMDTDKLAVIGEYEGKYSIGYGEITALNTHMIQKLMRRVAALESRLEE